MKDVSSAAEEVRRGRKVLFWVCCGLVLIGVGVTLFIFRHEIDHFFKRFRLFFDRMYGQRPFLVVGIFLLIVGGIQLLCLPAHTLGIACAAYVIRKTLVSFFLFLFLTGVCSSLIYVFSRRFLRQAVRNRVDGSTVFRSIEIEMNNSPYKLSLLSRFLMIPNGLKDYMLSIIDHNYYRYILCALSANSLYTLQGCLIGTGLRILESNDQPIPWRHRPLSQKMISIVYVVVLAITGIAKIIIATKATRLLMKPQNPIVQPNTLLTTLRNSLLDPPTNNTPSTNILLIEKTN